MIRQIVHRAREEARAEFQKAAAGYLGWNRPRDPAQLRSACINLFRAVAEWTDIPHRKAAAKEAAFRMESQSTVIVLPEFVQCWTTQPKLQQLQRHFDTVQFTDIGLHWQGHTPSYY